MAIKIPIVSEFNSKGIRQAKATLADFGKNAGFAFAAVGAAAAVAGAAIIRFGNDSVQAASTLNESLNAVSVAYGSASESIVKLGEDSATRLGVTQSAFNAAAVRFSAFAERVVGTGGDVAGFVDDITTRAADFASVFNIDVADALQTFQSGLSGEAEPLKRFGINLLDSEVKAYALRTGLATVGKEMTEQQKVQARYGLLMEATSKTAGDFANTSGGLANQQRILTASFEDLQAEVGTALLPVIAEATGEFTKMIPALKDALVPISENLADVFRTKVLPAIQDFTKWLASPEGTKKIKEFTDSIIRGIEELVIFTGAVINNWTAIKNTAIAIGTAVVVYKTLTTAIQLATAAQLLLNVAVEANPYLALAKILAIVATAIVTAAVALDTFSKQQKAAREAATGLTGRTAELAAEQDRLKELVDNGVISFTDYKNAMKPVQDELGFITKDSILLRLETNKLNNINLSKFRSQLGDTRIDGQKLVNNARELAYYMAGGKPGGYKPLPDPADEITGGGQTAGEKAADARKKVQDLIKNTRKQVINAQEDYRKAVAKANSDFLTNEAKIQRDYAQKFADIIDQSKNRLRDAFRGIATFTVSQFISDFRQVEEARLRSFEDAKKVAEDLGKSFTEVFIAGDPVKAYLDSLRNKVAANQRLLSVSAQLLERGFSQTFIEQIISTGEDGGVALAEGILKSNPEVISEIKTLFKDIERVSETGANALADQLYEQQGLATRELNVLFEKTQSELLDALAANYTEYTDTLTDAAATLKDAITDITTDFNDAIEEMEGQLGGLNSTVTAFRNMLKGLYDSTVDATKPLLPKGAGKTSDGVGFEFDINSALGTNLLQNTQQTIINVNVQTDATQSTAMVGKAVGNAITKYVSTGGQVRVVSGNVAV